MDLRQNADKTVKGGCSMTPRFILVLRSSLQSVSSKGTENQRSEILAYVILVLGDGKTNYPPFIGNIPLTSILPCARSICPGEPLHDMAHVHAGVINSLVLQ